MGCVAMVGERFVIPNESEGSKISPGVYPELAEGVEMTIARSKSKHLNIRRIKWQAL